MGDRGGCAPEPYRTPTTLGHATKTQSHNSSTSYIDTKTRSLPKTRRQRNMAQMKEQNKTPEKELNKMEISNLSDAEFKTLVIRMRKELSEDLNSIKKIS